MFNLGYETKLRFLKCNEQNVELDYGNSIHSLGRVYYNWCTR